VNSSCLSLIIAGVTCPLLDNPLQGSVVYSDGERGFGTTATYSCDEGHGITDGDMVRLCQPGGNGNVIGIWSKEGPSCERK